MPAYIKQGKGWKQTGFVAESRTTKFSTPKPGSEEEHRLNRLISIIAARLDAQGGARADIPRDVAPMCYETRLPRRRWTYRRLLGECGSG